MYSITPVEIYNISFFKMANIIKHTPTQEEEEQQGKKETKQSIQGKAKHRQGLQNTHHPLHNTTNRPHSKAPPPKYNET
jgi:protein tyrosine phosphatase (PTP) superfamily phosphohydrolase (DUF442 family)